MRFIFNAIPYIYSLINLNDVIFSAKWKQDTEKKKGGKGRFEFAGGFFFSNTVCFVSMGGGGMMCGGCG